MEQYIKEITQSPAFALASFAVGILGLVLAIVFYRRTKCNKSFSFAHRSIPIFRDSTPLVSKLRVQYEGKDTKNLTLTHMAFWNSGNETIRDIDLVGNDALRVAVEEGTILDAELLFATQKANNISLAKPQEASVDLAFRFLDAQHGGVVRIVHTATSRRHIDMRGTLMGVGAPKEIAERITDRVRRRMPFPRSMSHREFKWIFTIAVVIMTGGMLAALFAGGSAEASPAHPTGPWRYVLLLILAPYWFMVVGAHRRQLPKEMEQYLQDFGTETKA